MSFARLASLVTLLFAPLLLAGACSVVNKPDEPIDPEEGDCEATNTLTDCGACGVACAPANATGATCASGSCEYGGCESGFLDCDGDSANGCEADASSDETCGVCGNACAANESCTDGQCCTANSVDCAGTCSDLTSDPLHCGSCSNSCPSELNAQPTCVNSACGLQCLGGYDDCDMTPGCETDVSADLANCGGCNAPCPTGGNATYECQASQCVISMCAAGFDNCDNVVDNGCEADLSLPATCGSCTNPCPANQGCFSGTCAAGVMAFGEFRPQMKCGDFVFNGANYQQYCFTLKTQTLCIGQTSGGVITCTDTANGVHFGFDFNATWPMRFTPNTPSCLNYHPQFVQNLALALGYANYQVNQTKTGNSCARTYIDANGNFTQTTGDAGQAQIYDIDFF